MEKVYGNDFPFLKAALFKDYVRQIREAYPNTDICFVYTTAEVYVKAMVEEGKPVYAVEEDEKVADFRYIQTDKRNTVNLVQSI